MKGNPFQKKAAAGSNTASSSDVFSDLKKAAGGAGSKLDQMGQSLL